MLSGKLLFIIKIFGENIYTISKLANRIKNIISKIEGVTDLNIEQTAGAPQLQIQFDRKKIAQYGINVNAILPGYIFSPSAFKLRGCKQSDDVLFKMQEFGYKIPLGRQGTPQDVGNLVLFLASDESNYLTGSEIIIDGGEYIDTKSISAG